ncbi:RNA polymerase subunit sigma-70 [Microbacterium sp. HD4P20]|uniref:RNA polymerase subunit sigma-70 n=1 Tax=Microbacterium sp. HD4P20 TaxID=2864874 RepID=UPI001C63D974|nr:RNA polymerase subunit sigma-70 [Microbacterium sp. HD4P20]MCP2635397.1 RNA polymerase subunit sigma-70 [Microbacterium sp. HD4P20]
MATDLVDQAGLERAVERHRRELHVHCYRLLGSFEEAEDAVQDAIVRAWVNRASFDRGDNLRAWLYRIATNVCLDELRRRKRTPQIHSLADTPWLQPYPDHLLDALAPSERTPDEIVAARDTIELAFVAALQLLPAQQRAVLIMRDVIGWSAAEAADILDTSVPAVNSALQRARATMQRHRPEPDNERRAGLSAEERALLGRYIALHENPDPAAMAALVRDDVRVTMPPQPICFEGWEALAPLHEKAFGPGGLGEWKLLPTSVNRMPAAACYLRPPGEERFKAFKLDVLRVEDDLVAEITTFERVVFAWLDLPLEL